jgi:putative transposase
VILEQEHLYHIYNQGNNKQKIFYSRNNYLFFLNKISTYVLPFTDIIAWCLMPNHFHLLVYTINYGGCITGPDSSESHAESRSTALRSTTSNKTLNKSIGILLTSYTQAINKQENRSGALFKPHTKAECLTKAEGITPSFFDTTFGAKINMHNPEKEYPQICFNYIHNNPVKAGLVNHMEDWEFSSYRDYCGARNGTLINRNRAEEFGIKLNIQ